MTWWGATAPNQAPAERANDARGGGVGEELRELLRRAAGRFATARGADPDPDRMDRALDRAIGLLHRSGGRAVALDDPAYPNGLRSLSSAPPVVFLAGAWDHEGPVVAVVGARDASDDGCDVACSLARSLAEEGVAVVSGLARGIDAAAHRGALGAGGRSGAVLGTGLDRCYPASHRDLSRELTSSLGLMSEILPGSVSTASTFASRNRLVAAISDAVVVVQGREQSGALLTAEAARRLDRPVAAIPWDSRDPLGAAPHALIRSGVAMLARGASDILDLLDIQSSRRREPSADRTPAPTLPAGIGERETRLWRALRSRPQPLEVAARHAELSIADAGAALVLLEILGRARREPGGDVRRVRRI